MIFEQLAIGGDRNFAYLIGDESSKLAAVVDPGVNPEMILEAATGHNLTIQYVINTHGHFDHIGANQNIVRATGAKIASFDPGANGLNLNHGDSLTLGDLTLEIFHTPGHTQDSICVLAEDHLCTGDTLFVGKVGGTGFGPDARQEYDSLHNVLLKLPGSTKVYPGHHYGVAPTSTIAHEKGTNPFLLQPDFDAFVHLKKNWAEYKRNHGIG